MRSVRNSPMRDRPTEATFPAHLFLPKPTIVHYRRSRRDIHDKISIDVYTSWRPHTTTIKRYNTKERIHRCALLCLLYIEYSSRDRMKTIFWKKSFYLFLSFGISQCDIVMSSERTDNLEELEPSCISPGLILDMEQKKLYESDGFIVMKDVLREDLVSRLSKAGAAVAKIGQKFPAYFSVVERGVIFDSGLERSATETFREAALYSSIPRIAAELMQLDDRTQSLRVLRDIVIAKGIDDITCDWHVDDQGFWPESFLSSASEKSGVDQDGVNVWIALDDMPFEYQGSMAVSAGSHKTPWRFEAYEAMGQNRTKDGGSSKEAILARLEEKRRTGEASLGACQIGVARPDLREKLESRKVSLDVKKGDIIFSTRNLFHRTTDVTESGKEYYKSKGHASLNRYSIRYTAGTARLPNGWVAEWSAIANSNNVGLSLDDIVTHDDPLWYPKVWPTVDSRLEDQLDLLAEKQLEVAKSKVLAEIIEMFTPKQKSSDS